MVDFPKDGRPIIEQTFFGVISCTPPSFAIGGRL